MKANYFRTGLVGYPLGHSLSPIIHKAMYESLALEGEYLLYPFEPLPQGETVLLKLLRKIKDGLLHGLNVTIPHKQSVIHYLDRLSQIATHVGAVNTIYMRDGLLIGDNTDVDGFMNDVMQIHNGKLESAVIIGAGGAARAAAFGLLQRNCSLYIVSRRIEQARELADDLGAVIDRPKQEIICVEHTRDGLESIPSGIDLIVNATPLGMHPKVDASPWFDDVSFPAHASVYDMVYNPSVTKFVNQALACGLPATTGLGMLIGQAAISFERWTGMKPSSSKVHDLIKESLWQ